eukprot:TRINITY_DN5483_c0_g1_i8.p1 TRINITY_DN5483_c0_g1~~TRINITY_DN5483_c0_g1_i8.p1  ORF type:complete len:806 (+),score=252.84 TRINITY_DN5483_c0_g1_i8:54-2471(+)
MDDDPVGDKAKCKVKLQYLLICATAMSTTLSLLGGLLMYIESLKSLEGVVEDVSSSQVQGLRQELRACLDEVYQIEKEMHTLITYRVTQNHPITVNPNGALDMNPADVQSWQDFSEWVAWPRIRWSHWIDEIGIEAIPHADGDPALFYFHTWKDLLTPTGVEYVKVFYNQNTKQVQDGNITKARAFGISPTNGSVLKTTENYHYDLFVNDLICHPEMSNAGPPGSKVMECAQRPEVWLSGDLTPFIYIYVDTWYVAPPPPHPWSKYKFIGIKVAWFFKQWEEALKQYAERTSNTKVLVFDALTDIVYATSTGEQLMDRPCLGEDRDVLRQKQHCIMHLVNDSQMNSAWNSVKKTRMGFWTENIVGGDHFVRTEILMTLDNGLNVTRFDAIILWIQSTSVVQDQVNAALILLVIFCCAVMCCDLCVMCLEYIAVVIPVSRIADSTSYLTTMDIEGARREILYAVRKVSVTEVVHLARGLLFACNVLDQYKAYLPSTLFTAEADTESSNGRPPSHTESSMRSSKNSMQSRKQETADLKSRLTVGMNNAKGAVLMLHLGTMGSPKSFCSKFTDAISNIQERLLVTGGVLHSYTLTDPSVVYLSWGIAGNCSDALYKACTCADLLKTSNLLGWAAVTHGVMKAGNIGSNTNKGFAIMGAPLEPLRMMYRVAEHYATQGKPIIIFPSKSADVLKGRIEAFVVGLAVNGSERTTLAEVAGCVAGENEEWMYTLESGSADPMAEVFKKLLANSGDNQAIKEAVEAVDTKSLTPTQAWVHERLLQGTYCINFSPEGVAFGSGGLVYKDIFTGA